jgi:hypothetical protein
LVIGNTRNVSKELWILGERIGLFVRLAYSLDSSPLFIWTILYEVERNLPYNTIIPVPSRPLSLIPMDVKTRVQLMKSRDQTTTSFHPNTRIPDPSTPSETIFATATTPDNLNKIQNTHSFSHWCEYGTISCKTKTTYFQPHLRFLASASLYSLTSRRPARLDYAV